MSLIVVLSTFRSTRCTQRNIHIPPRTRSNSRERRDYGESGTLAEGFVVRHNCDLPGSKTPLAATTGFLILLRLVVHLWLLYCQYEEPFPSETSRTYGRRSLLVGLRRILRLLVALLRGVIGLLRRRVAFVSTFKDISASSSTCSARSSLMNGQRTGPGVAKSTRPYWFLSQIGHLNTKKTAKS